MSVSHDKPLARPPDAIPEQDAPEPQGPPCANLVVVVVGLGMEAREFVLAEGSTVGDLLREAYVTADQWDVVGQQRRLDEAEPLQDGSFVYLLPKDRPEPVGHSWRDLAGAFKDDPSFREIAEAGRAIREAEWDRS